MALAVSQAFKEVQARRGGKRARVRVGYKRRYFNPDAVAYQYEANYNWLSMRDIVDPQEIVHQLDVTAPGIFKSSTITLRMKNTRNEWHASVNDPSVFAADVTAPNGYDDAYLLVQVTDGFQLPDGTWEDVPQFTGYALDFNPSPLTGYMEIPVSATLLLDKCRAIQVNTPVAAEAVALSAAGEEMSPYTGDGTTALLKTKSTGVIKVVAVYATNPSTGVVTTLTPTTHYTVSIPTDGTEAKITLVSPGSWTGKNFTADVINKDLLTTSVGVVSVAALYADTVPLAQGADYSVSLPTDVEPATMTLTEPELWIGKSFTWDGTKGTRNLSVEAAVALFCESAGVTSSMRSIAPVIFPGGLSGSKTIDTQSDWQAGTLLQNVSTTAFPGNLIADWVLFDDFTDLSDSDWSYSGSGGHSAAAGYLSVSRGPGSPFAFSGKKATSMVTGTCRWRMKVTHSISGAAPFSNTGGWLINSSGFGYGVVFDPFTNGVIFRRLSGSGYTALATLISGRPTGWIEWRITRDDGGAFKIYADQGSGMTLLASVTDNTTTSFSYFQAYADSTSDDGSEVDVDDIYFTPALDGTSVFGGASDSVAEYEFNLLSTPTALGLLDNFIVLNGGTVTLKTTCAPDVSGSPGTYDSLQVLGAGGQMASTPRQWLKIRVEIAAAAGSLVSPEIQKLVAHFTLSTVTLSLVAPTSGTAYDFIQKYASTCNYEAGMDEAGIFFFRPRSVSGEPVMALDPWTNLSGLDNASKGWDQVYTISHVSAPPYDYYYDSTSAAESEPTSVRRFGPVQNDIDLSGILFANDVQIGKAATQADWQDRHLPKWSCRATGKSAAWVQLSDPVSLTYVPDPKMLGHIAGDPLQASGFAGPAGVALAIQKKMKVVGSRRALFLRTTQWQLQEILS